MTREQIIKLAQRADVIDELHAGCEWTNRLLCFAESLIEAERSKWAGEIDILKNELERLHELYIFMDKKVFDGSQK